MNKSAIIDFVDTAKETIEGLVKLKAYEYGVTEKGAEANQTVINGKVLSATEKSERDALISAIESAKDSQGFAHGFENVIEEVAYTWFNRFIALRFMEVNGYLPSHTRVFSDETGKFAPQIMKEATTVAIDGIDRVKVSDLIQHQKNEELFKYLVILQCNELSKPIPEMFERISDYTELLFPNGLLKKDSIVAKMVENIPEEDWKEQVQIIGWMYQFYISKKKDAVNASKKPVTKDTIAAVTQLFTPDWIVRYMTENSIGRIWLESYPDSPLKKEMKYYVVDAEQPEETKAKLESIRYKNVDPKDIKVIEPCCGSGHILVYCFDILYKLYTEKGYSTRDIPSLILQNNLVGLDVDKRASQLAAFSLIMKARSYDSGFFRRGVLPKVYEIKDTAGINTFDLTKSLESNRFTKKATDTALYLNDTFRDGKLIGSLLKLTPHDYEGFILEAKERKNDKRTIGLFEGNFFDVVLPKLIEIAEIAMVMSEKYDVMITNPPYRGVSTLAKPAVDYASTYYPNSKSDLFGMFMETNFVNTDGYIAMINMQSWMFLTSFEKLRHSILRHQTIMNMAHLGAHAFEMIEGEVVQTTTFILKNSFIPNFNGSFIRLANAADKEKSFLGAISNNAENKMYVRNASLFEKIPGNPICFWAADKIYGLFKNPTLAEVCVPKCGLKTGITEKYVLTWQEVPFNEIGFRMADRLKAKDSRKKWFPASDGQEYRKWYGNNYDVVFWENDGYEIRHLYMPNGKLKSRPQNMDFYFKEGITWSALTSKKLSLRMTPIGNIISGAGYGCFNEKIDMNPVMALLNSNIAAEISRYLSGTLNYEVGVLARIPVISSIFTPEISQLVDENIELAKEDWDSFEQSWDFTSHPLIPKNQGDHSLFNMFNYWSSECERRFSKLKTNEETLNNILIHQYGLEAEINGDITDDEITIRRADSSREIKSLLSYFAGISFGRYSLDKDGLIFAGGKWDINAYRSFLPSGDGILILNGEFFGDCGFDSKVFALIRKVFGDQYFEENISFIANALDGKGSPRDVIKNYLLSGFYADHMKNYQKKPIYWLFDAGKKNSFKALVYIHRYTPDTLATLRTDYILPLLERYSSRSDYLEKELPTLTGSEQTKVRKELEMLKGQYQELSEYEIKIHHLADQRIELDLDDGVKANYAKLQDVLAPLK